MKKIEIIIGTTIRGESVNAGEIVEVDDSTFHLLKSQGQARLFAGPVEEVKIEDPKDETKKPKGK